MVVAISSSIAAGAVSVSSDQLLPTAPSAQPAGSQRTVMPANMTATISA
jgi:hypothetical protein